MSTLRLVCVQCDNDLNVLVSDAMTVKVFPCLVCAEEIGQLREQLRPRDPETELPECDVEVLGQVGGRFEIMWWEGEKWVAADEYLDLFSIKPDVWWPFPEQQKGKVDE